MTAEEWADAMATFYPRSERGVFFPSSMWPGDWPPEVRHNFAAVLLHGHEGGFTHEDVMQLKRCADNAERYASNNMWHQEDHDAHEHARTVIARLEKLLPPEEE